MCNQRGIHRFGSFINQVIIKQSAGNFKKTLISNKHHCSIMGVITGAFIIDLFSY